jgi:thiol-disulfide isomerase/thioredoxin
MRIPEYSQKVQCNEKGEFEQLIPLTSPRVVQFETGIYELYLYMEPGFHYEVELPAFVEKTWNDQLFPFYQAQSLPLTILARTSLSTGEQMDGALDVNHAISRFDTLFAQANTALIKRRKLGQVIHTDSLIQSLETSFAEDSSQFFSDYRRYRYGILKLNEGRSNLTDLSLTYLGPTVKAWHPGFVELFRALFKDFIFYYSGSGQVQNFRNLINHNQDLQEARRLILDHPAVWCDTLADMILLQEFSELFYRGEYHKEAILIMLDSMASNPVTPQFGVFSKQLKQKLSSLVTGNTPPPISMEDMEGTIRTLKDFEGKYTYLFFGTTDHYGCMMEYPFLQSFKEKHNAYLEVVSIMASEDRNSLGDFMQRNGYEWTVLPFDGQNDILNIYMIKAYPTAYLIDRDGKLLLSPATLPSEGFEQQLFRIMRSRGEI